MYLHYTGTCIHEHIYRGQKRMLFTLIYQSLLYYFKTGLLSEPGVGWRPGSPVDRPASPNTVLASQGCRDTQRLFLECWIWTQVLIPAQQEELLVTEQSPRPSFNFLMIERTLCPIEKDGVGAFWATMHCLFEIKLGSNYLRRPVKNGFVLLQLLPFVNLNFAS